MPPLSFYTTWKHQKTRGFLMFSGGVERGHWHEMGKYSITSKFCWKSLTNTKMTYEDWNSFIFRFKQSFYRKQRSLNNRTKYTKVAIRRCSSKYAFLKISQYSQQNTCWTLFLIKGDSNTGVFMWILRKF